MNSKNWGDSQYLSCLLNPVILRVSLLCPSSSSCVRPANRTVLWLLMLLLLLPQLFSLSSCEHEFRGRCCRRRHQHCQAFH